MRSRTKIRILMVEASPVMQKACREALETDGVFEVISTVSRLSDAVGKLTIYPVDVVLLDLGLPALDPTSAVQQLLATGSCPVVLTVDRKVVGESRISQALAAGASSVVDRLDVNSPDAKRMWESLTIALTLVIGRRSLFQSSIRSAQMGTSRQPTRTSLAKPKLPTASQPAQRVTSGMPTQSVSGLHRHSSRPSKSAPPADKGRIAEIMRQFGSVGRQKSMGRHRTSGGPKTVVFDPAQLRRELAERLETSESEAQAARASSQAAATPPKRPVTPPTPRRSGAGLGGGMKRPSLQRTPSLASKSLVAQLPPLPKMVSSAPQAAMLNSKGPSFNPPTLDSLSEAEPPAPQLGGPVVSHRLIALGASTGGVESLPRVLRHLPSTGPGIVVVQHMPEGFTKLFAERLAKSSGLPSREARDGEVIMQGHILVAPGGKQLTVHKADKGYYVRVKDGPKVSGHRPSVDALFESVADAVGRRAVAALLTGMGADGAKGMLKIRQAGGRTIAQDESTCVVFGMPKEAIALGGAEFIKPLDAIGLTIADVMSLVPRPLLRTA